MKHDEDLFDDLDEYIAERDKREPGFAALVEAQTQRCLAAQTETACVSNDATQQPDDSGSTDVATSQSTASSSR
jgi:hypothetical protein